MHVRSSSYRRWKPNANVLLLLELTATFIALPQKYTRPLINFIICKRILPIYKFSSSSSYSWCDKRIELIGVLKNKLLACKIYRFSYRLSCNNINRTLFKKLIDWMKTSSVGSLFHNETTIVTKELQNSESHLTQLTSRHCPNDNGTLWSVPLCTSTDFLTVCSCASSNKLYFQASGQQKAACTLLVTFTPQTFWTT
jgi:hypothetical protein